MNQPPTHALSRLNEQAVDRKGSAIGWVVVDVGGVKTFVSTIIVNRNDMAYVLRVAVTLKEQKMSKHQHNKRRYVAAV